MDTLVKIWLLLHSLILLDKVSAFLDIILIFFSKYLIQRVEECTLS